MTIQLYNYQREGVKRLHALNGRALLCDEQGLGKTPQALQYLVDCPDKRPAIVVCPAVIKYAVWEHQAARHFGLRVEVLSGTKPPRRPSWTKRGVVVINYDILYAWLNYLIDLGPKLVILDEVHYCAGRNTRRTRATRRLCESVDHVIALSGTPLTNRPSELWPTLNILWPKQFPNFWPFAMKYCGPKRTNFGWDLTGSSNLKELHGKLNNLGMIRRLKEDVLTDLPSKIRSVLHLPLPDRKEYDEASNDFLRWLCTQGEEKARRASRAEGIVKLGYLKRLAGRLKLPLVMDWIDDFLIQSSRKVIVFATHRSVVETLRDRYRGECAIVDGSTGSKARAAEVTRFQNDPCCRVFIGNIKAAGIGITLTAASTVLFAEIDWNPGLHLQAEDRSHRIGQKSSVNIYYMIGEDTIESRLLKIIQKKQRVARKVLDGKGRGADLNIYDQLIRSYNIEQP